MADLASCAILKWQLLPGPSPLGSSPHLQFKKSNAACSTLSRFLGGSSSAPSSSSSSSNLTEPPPLSSASASCGSPSRHPHRPLIQPLAQSFHHTPGYTWLRYRRARLRPSRSIACKASRGHSGRRWRCPCRLGYGGLERPTQGCNRRPSTIRLYRPDRLAYSHSAHLSASFLLPQLKEDEVLDVEGVESDRRTTPVLITDVALAA
ncbi:hypothetical protein BJX66DRAFT_27068 [Aspergillus keveii]|uniref:Uncharacterized protein n=1 Tax=Aspergillus keveii TaxID=714993 RepID=A0ABR4FU02_9EURO